MSDRKRNKKPGPAKREGGDHYANFIKADKYLTRPPRKTFVVPEEV
jgi:hypothetical protein